MELFIDKDKLREALTTTSDGKLKGGNNYDDFILNAIDERTDKHGQTDLAELHTDFCYMICELNKARKIIEGL